MAHGLGYQTQMGARMPPEWQGAIDLFQSHLEPGLRAAGLSDEIMSVLKPAKELKGKLTLSPSQLPVLVQ